MKLPALISTTLLSAAISLDAHSALYQFNCITGPSANCDAGELQIGVEVINLGVDDTTGHHQVEFRFTNASDGANSSIAQIYFYDGTLLGVHSILDDPNDVYFREGTSANPQLPGLGISKPVTRMFDIFDVNAVNPAPHKGINPGEQLGVVFDLLPDMDYDDVLSAMALPLSPNSGSMTIGLHVISFDDGGSESFLHDITAVPVPAAAWLFLSGMGVLWRVARRA